MQNSAQKLHGKCGWLGATIGRKQLIGLTGLGLCGFLLMHMLGNLLIFAGPQAYNEYSYKLVSNPLIYIAEAGLLAMFIGHLVFASAISIRNLGARDSRYAVMSNGAKGTSMIQRTLWAQGILIFVFLVLHLISFKYGTHYVANYGAGEIRDLHKLIVEIFQQPLYVAWYIVALIVLGFHVSHGLGSSFQSLGINHPRYNCAIRGLSITYALVVIIGFLSQPLYVYFIHRG